MTIFEKDRCSQLEGNIFEKIERIPPAYFWRETRFAYSNHSIRNYVRPTPRYTDLFFNPSIDLKDAFVKYSSAVSNIFDYNLIFQTYNENNDHPLTGTRSMDRAQTLRRFMTSVEKLIVWWVPHLLVPYQLITSWDTESQYWLGCQVIKIIVALRESTPLFHTVSCSYSWVLEYSIALVASSDDGYNHLNIFGWGPGLGFGFSYGKNIRKKHRFFPSVLGSCSWCL